MKYLNDAGGRFKLPLKDDAGKTLATLLWGDPLQEIERSGDRVKVRARRRTGWLPASAVGDTGLLEIYVIDVGQGDGVLMRTPHDDAWHMIDAGIRAAEQMTRKGAANFVRWKFIDDLQRDRITLQNMIVTHPDADHYGGMVDLLSGALPDGRTFGIEVQNFWHCGIGRFKDGDKLGTVRADTSTTPLPQPGTNLKPEGRFIVELLDGKTHFARPKRTFSHRLRGAGQAGGHAAEEGEQPVAGRWLAARICAGSGRCGHPRARPGGGKAGRRRQGAALAGQRECHAQRPFGGAARGLRQRADAAHR